MIETDDFLADLERELRAAAERGAAPAVPWRRRVVRPIAVGAAGLAVAAAGVVALGLSHHAVELWAPNVTANPAQRAAEKRAAAIVKRAMRQTASVGGCRPFATQPLKLSDAPPSAAITTVLPGLAKAPVPAAPVPAVAQINGGTVLRGTVRQLPLTRGLSASVFVVEGPSANGPRDPAACLAMRAALAAKLSAGDPAAVGEAADRQLRDDEAERRAGQTLWVFSQVEGQRGMGGAGVEATRSQPLKRGVVLSGGAGPGRSVYIGIASRDATQVAVEGPGKRRLPAAVPVREGFYGVIIPRGTGPVSLVEKAADGRALRTIPIRRRSRGAAPPAQPTASSAASRR